MDEFYDSGFRLLFYKGIVCRKGFRHFVSTFCNFFGPEIPYLAQLFNGRD